MAPLLQVLYQVIAKPRVQQAKWNFFPCWEPTSDEEVAQRQAGMPRAVTDWQSWHYLRRPRPIADSGGEGR
jgi:hypothetical protein